MLPTNGTIGEPRSQAILFDDISQRHIRGCTVYPCPINRAPGIKDTMFSQKRIGSSTLGFLFKSQIEVFPYYTLRVNVCKVNYLADFDN